MSLWQRLQQPIRFGSGAAIGRQELEFFVRQLAALLLAGVPLERSLQVLAQQGRPEVSKIFSALRDRLREGLGLHQAMASYPADFPETFRALVAVGESSGSLPQVLQRVADAMAAANQLRTSVLSALAYPAIVTTVALLVVFALMAYVVPQIVEVLVQQNQELPLLTRMLIGLSAAMQAYGGLLLMLVLMLAAAWVWAWRQRPAFRLWVDARLLRLPLVGPMILANESARLASTLAISVTGGVSLLRALRTATAVMGNRLLRSRLEQASEWVREGAELGRALDRAGGFPPLLIQLVSTGERAGELPRMLELAAAQLSETLRQRAFLLTSFLEPALILLMGLIVLVIVLAVMMPLIEMNTLLS